MSQVFHRRPACGCAVAAAGIAIRDRVARRHLHASGGAAVFSSPGHGHLRETGQVGVSSGSAAAMAAALELAAATARAMRAGA
jgi:hypothetical protein